MPEQFRYSYKPLHTLPLPASQSSSYTTGSTVMPRKQTRCDLCVEFSCDFVAWHGKFVQWAEHETPARFRYSYKFKENIASDCLGIVIAHPWVRSDAQKTNQVCVMCRIFLRFHCLAWPGRPLGRRGNASTFSILLQTPVNIAPPRSSS